MTNENLAQTTSQDRISRMKQLHGRSVRINYLYGPILIGLAKSHWTPRCNGRPACDTKDRSDCEAIITKGPYAGAKHPLTTRCEYLDSLSIQTLQSLDNVQRRSDLAILTNKEIAILRNSSWFPSSSRSNNESRIGLLHSLMSKQGFVQQSFQCWVRRSISD